MNNGYQSSHTKEIMESFYLHARFFQEVVNLTLLNHEYSIKELGSN